MSVLTEASELARAITGRAYLSWSQLQSYQSCPRAFAYRYVDAAEAEFTPSSLLFGGAIHEAISIHNEAQMAGLAPPPLDLLTDVVRQGMEPIGPPIRFNEGEDLDGLIELAGRMLKAFVESGESRDDENAPIVGVEEAVTGSLDPDLPDIQARIDLVSITSEGVAVTDYKSTRSSWPKGRAEEHAGQLHLYGDLTAAAMDEHQRIASLQFITITKAKKPKVQRHPVSIEPARLDGTIEQVRDIWRGIVEGVFPARPGWPCRNCPFQSQCDSAAV